MVVSLAIAYPSGDVVTVNTLTGDDPATTGATEQGWYSFCNLLLDEDYNGDGVGSEPAYTISVDLNQPALADYTATQIDVSSATNDRNDSDDHAGTTAAPVQGLTNTDQNVDPTAEQAVASYDFGVVETVLIGNRIWYEDDGDGDGTNGTPTAASGLTVTVTASDGTTYTAVTDANGLYTVTVPANATYTVTVDTPAGYTPSTVLVPGTDSTPGDINDQNHASSGAVVTVGTADNLDIDFAFTPIVTYAIGNLVWIDGEATANGQYNAGTDTLADGVIVNLYRVVGGNAESTPFMTTTTTSGAYQFTGLPAGTYEVGIPGSEFRTIGSGGNGTLVDGMDTPYGVVGPNSQGTDTTDDNGDHNTIYPAANDTIANGVRSNQITLGDGAEPTGEPNYGLVQVEPDERSDWTVDFAFAERDATAVEMVGSTDTTQRTTLLICWAMFTLMLTTGWCLCRRSVID